MLDQKGIDPTLVDKRGHALLHMVLINEGNAAKGRDSEDQKVLKVLNPPKLLKEVDVRRILHMG